MDAQTSSWVAAAVLLAMAMFPLSDIGAHVLRALRRRRVGLAQDLAELDRWRTQWQEYRRWLAEFREVAMALDNLRAEVLGKESLNACHPPGDEGPWTVDGLRYRMRERRKPLPITAATTRAALKAAAEFLQNDEARQLLGLHRIRVNGDMMTRGEVADLLQVELVRVTPPLEAPRC